MPVDDKANQGPRRPQDPVDQLTSGINGLFDFPNVLTYNVCVSPLRANLAVKIRTDTFARYQIRAG